MFTPGIEKILKMAKDLPKYDWYVNSSGAFKNRDPIGPICILAAIARGRDHRGGLVSFVLANGGTPEDAWGIMGANDNYLYTDSINLELRLKIAEILGIPENEL